MLILGSNRHFCAPVPGSSAITSLNGEQKITLSSTNSGVAWNLVRAIASGGRTSRSPVRNCQALTRLPTLAGVIMASAENRVPPRSPPQCSHAKAGAAMKHERASRRNSFRMSVMTGTCGCLFRFLCRVRRSRHAPRIVFFLRLGDALQRGLVGFLVDLRAPGSAFFCASPACRLLFSWACAGTASRASATAAIVKAFIAIFFPLKLSPARMSQSNCGRPAAWPSRYPIPRPVSANVDRGRPRPRRETQVILTATG